MSPLMRELAITSPSPGLLPDGGRPAASHAATVVLRRTRCGAFGHLTSKSSSQPPGHRLGGDVVPPTGPRFLRETPDTGRLVKAQAQGAHDRGRAAHGRAT